jgi:sugar lactone lactonase YvrE
MIKQKFIGFCIVATFLLLGGCKGVAVTKPAAELAPERAQPKSTAARASAKLLVGTQQGGARQGVNLNLNNFVSTFAGKAGSTGAEDGHAVQARFDAPKGITTDGINLYVADLNNHTIRKIDIESGAVETIAGMAGKKGSSDGRGSAARFNRPYGITTEGDYLYVSDSNNHSVRRINIESGAVTTLAGRAGEVGYVDGAGKKARFFIPEGITTDGSNLYVADTHNHSVRKISLAKNVVTTFAGLSGAPGFFDDTGNKARFSFPKGLVSDGRNLYVADFGNHKIRKITLSNAAVSTLAGTVKEDGAASEQGEPARFNYPTGITTDGRNLYVADTFNRTIRKIVISGGAVSTIAGREEAEGTADGTGTDARFGDPVGITGDGSDLYVTDSANNTIRRIR